MAPRSQGSLKRERDFRFAAHPTIGPISDDIIIERRVAPQENGIAMHPVLFTRRSVEF
jgi:hypothetical protein